VRERWFGATGRRVPEISLEGELELDDALVLDAVDDLDALRAAHEQGRPVVVRAADAASLKSALARPEVASVIVPTPELRDLDLTELTYG
jgi:hypothetical protein